MDNDVRARAELTVIDAITLAQRAENIADRVEQTSLTSETTAYPVALELRYLSTAIRAQCAELADALDKDLAAQSKTK